MQEKNWFFIMYLAYGEDTNNQIWVDFNAILDIPAVFNTVACASEIHISSVLIIFF